MSKVTAYYHIVFCTKGRENTIPLDYREDVYRFIWKEIKNLKCDLLRIGGITNHIHILVNLNPTVALSLLMKRVKGCSSTWMRTDDRFIAFKGWAADYYACTLSPEQKNAVVEYIKGQDLHHGVSSFNDEIKSMYRYADIVYDERDMK